MMQKVMKNPFSKTIIDSIYQGMLSDQSKQQSGMAVYAYLELLQPVLVPCPQQA